MPADRGRTGRRALGIVLPCFALLAGCTQDAPILAVRERLLATADPSERGGVRECKSGDELRPARGCPSVFHLRPSGDRKASGSGFRQQHWFPLELHGRPVVIERSHRTGRQDVWKELPAEVVESDRIAIDLSFEAPEDSKVVVRALALEPVERRYESREVAVPPSAVLQGAIAMYSFAGATAQAPVEFRIDALVGGEKREIFRRVLPEEDGADGWSPYRVDLSSFAGESVRLRFATRWATSQVQDAAAPLWSLPAVLAPVEKPGWSFVVVSLDTLRADHVGLYGSSRPTTPRLDRFGEQSAVFEHAWTTYPSTTASHMSLFTGLYPVRHRVFAPPAVLDASTPTVASLLAENGYRTAAVTEDGMIVARAGFLRGFDSYTEFQDANLESSGHVERVVDTATHWLARNRDERFYLFLHTYEVHSPHGPPEEFDRFTAGPDEDGFAKAKAAYAGEILYADREIGRLLDELDELGLADRTVVIVTSDHGEGFGENGVVGHGHSLAEEVTRIPLLLRVPGVVEPGTRIGAPASLVDVGPTILDLAGIETDVEMHGRSLLPLLSDPEAGRDRVVYVHHRRPGGIDEVAAADAEHKVVVRLDGETLESLDLSGEGPKATEVSEDLAAKGRRRAADYVGLSGAAAPTGSTQGLEIDPTTEGQLRALGYVD